MRLLLSLTIILFQAVALGIFLFSVGVLVWIAEIIIRS